MSIRPVHRIRMFATIAIAGAALVAIGALMFAMSAFSGGAALAVVGAILELVGYLAG
jgi:hypothetical protein